MRRRTLLRRLGAGGSLAAAGCLSAPADQPTGTTPTSSPTPREVGETADGRTATPADGAPRTVSVRSVDDAALRAAYDVAASATVTEPRVTTDHTAAVRLTLANRDDRDRTLTYVAEECGMNLLFGSRVDGEESLVLAPAGRDWTRARADCWRARDRYVSCGVPATTEEVTLPAGERATWRFALWATGPGPCMPPGRYRFERAFEAGGGTPTEGAPRLALVLSIDVPDA